MDPELHLATMSHYGLEAVLCVQVPPLHKTVLGAVEKTEPYSYNPDDRFLTKLGIILELCYLVTRRFLSLRNRACVMRSLWPLSLYSPHSLMTSHTITSVS